MRKTNPPFGIYNTEFCVGCLKRKAVMHSGHVRTGTRRIITAGWCGRCANRKAHETGKYAGFRGHWLPEMNPDEAARRKRDELAAKGERN